MFTKLNVFLFSLVASFLVQSTFAMERGPKRPADGDHAAAAGAAGAASAAPAEEEQHEIKRSAFKPPKPSMRAAIAAAAGAAGAAGAVRAEEEQHGTKRQATRPPKTGSVASKRAAHESEEAHDSDSGADENSLRISNKNLIYGAFEQLLEFIKSRPDIISIDASETEITDEQVMAILKLCRDRIETLDCSACPMIQKLTIRCPRMRSLSFYQSIALGSLAIDCPELTDLDITGCPIFYKNIFAAAEGLQIIDGPGGPAGMPDQFAVFDAAAAIARGLDDHDLRGELFDVKATALRPHSR